MNKMAKLKEDDLFIMEQQEEIIHKLKELLYLTQYNYYTDKSKLKASKKKCKKMIKKIKDGKSSEVYTIRGKTL